MNSWNYRVLRHTSMRSDGSAEVYFAVHEVYYDEKNRAVSCTENPSFVYGETPEELRRDLDRMAGAFKLPTLDYDSFGAKPQ